MNAISIVLKAISPIFVLVGLLHLVLGLGADVMLGADIPYSVLADPVLDSQNRFYGVVFALYGGLFYLCATNLDKYVTVLRLVLVFFFAGGIARVVSIIVVGMPSGLVLLLLFLELILPVILLLWIRRIV